MVGTSGLLPAMMRMVNSLLCGWCRAYSLIWMRKSGSSTVRGAIRRQAPPAEVITTRSSRPLTCGRWWSWRPCFLSDAAQAAQDAVEQSQVLAVGPLSFQGRLQRGGLLLVEIQWACVR